MYGSELCHRDNHTSNLQTNTEAKLQRLVGIDYKQALYPSSLLHNSTSWSADWSQNHGWVPSPVNWGLHCNT